MGEGARGEPAGEGTVAGTYQAARALIDAAEDQAQSLLAQAAHEARRREHEAEMLLAKARRVLVAAEERAAVIVATARSDAATPTVLDLDAELDDLGQVIAPRAARLSAGTIPARIDRMLATAISHAVDEAFPLDPTG